MFARADYPVDLTASLAKPQAPAWRDCAAGPAQRERLPEICRTFKLETAVLTRTTLIIGVTALYFALVAFIGYSVRRHASSSAGFTEGGKAFAPWLIAALMLSEFIGSSVSIGTAQKGFEDGISAAWNLVALSMGFLLLGVLLVGRYRRTKLNTISAILEQTYGKGVRYAASLLTIFSLNVVAVALYASGGAVLGAVMQIDRGIATVIVGIVAIFFVTVGGFRSVIYTNTLNAAIKYLGIVLALAFALTESGGYAHLRSALPSRMFDLSGVGVSRSSHDDRGELFYLCDTVCHPGPRHYAR